LPERSEQFHSGARHRAFRDLAQSLASQTEQLTPEIAAPSPGTTIWVFGL
jgi:hypothetical protein